MSRPASPTCFPAARRELAFQPAARRFASTMCLAVAVAALVAAPARSATCLPSATHLCLNDERFEVGVDWKDFDGNTGSGQVVPVASADSGLFWFFGADNWEILVKVLDACGVNGRVWVFSAATTNVEYTLRVTDTATGSIRSYFNPLGNAAVAITDTAAFASCGGAGTTAPRSASTVRLDEQPPPGLSINRPPHAIRTKDCARQPIACPSTVDGMLEVTDCEYEVNGVPDGSFFDEFGFEGIHGEEVEIDLTSNEFETYLELHDPSGTKVAFSDGDPDIGAHIVHALDATGEWTIIANNFPPVPGDPGAYTLSLACRFLAPGPPAAPSNLVATPFSDSAIDLFWTDNSGNELDFEVQARPEGGTFQTVGIAPANSEQIGVAGLEPGTTYTFRVRARNADGNSAFSNLASATTGSFPGPCLESATTLCLVNGRFQVRVNWEDFLGNTGQAQRVPFGSKDSGLLWFFGPDNWEMLIKVLDACEFSNHYWVFGAATTNVEYVLEVVDTETGATKRYTNPLGVPASTITDTTAFATCP